MACKLHLNKAFFFKNTEIKLIDYGGKFSFLVERLKISHC